MIISKPKISTLFSVGIFVVIAFGLAIYGGVNAVSSDNKTLWYALTYIAGSIGLIVLIKILTGLKTLSVSKEKFNLKIPFKFLNIKFLGKEIEKWSHSSIKTYGGQYEEIILRLNSGKEYSISKQENTEFDRVLTYMRKKYKKTQA